MGSTDWFVFIALCIILAFVFTRRWRRWRHEAGWLSVPKNAFNESDAASVYLIEKGFNLLSGKTKIPLNIKVTGADQEQLSSRLFIDFMAEREKELWIVKKVNKRKPPVWTGSGIRDHFLVYFLLFGDQAAGIILLDMESTSPVHWEIRFKSESP